MKSTSARIGLRHGGVLASDLPVFIQGATQDMSVVTCASRMDLATKKDHQLAISLWQLQQSDAVLATPVAERPFQDAVACEMLVSMDMLKGTSDGWEAHEVVRDEVGVRSARLFSLDPGWFGSRRRCGQTTKLVPPVPRQFR